MLWQRSQQHYAWIELDFFDWDSQQAILVSDLGLGWLNFWGFFSRGGIVQTSIDLNFFIQWGSDFPIRKIYLTKPWDLRCAVSLAGVGVMDSRASYQGKTD